MGQVSIALFAEWLVTALGRLHLQPSFPRVNPPRRPHRLGSISRCLTGLRPPARAPDLPRYLPRLTSEPDRL
jgi:hypothetical protein